jgi:hypothetical protein
LDGFDGSFDLDFFLDERISREIKKITAIKMMMVALTFVTARL